MENKEIRRSLKNYHRTMELLREMLASKDTMLEALGQSCANHTRDLDQQRNCKQQLQRMLCTVQQEKAQLQLKYNSLQHDHVQCCAELEDERKDKQVYMQRCYQLEIDKQGLQNTVTAQTETITDMRVRIDENDNYIDRLTDKVREMKQRLHKESKEKSNILQDLIQKSHIVSELEKDKEILMLENEAQGKYFLELKGEKMQLEKENTELRISARKCKVILTEQYDHVIQSIEASLLLLNDNLTQMSVKNSELENVTEQQSAKISDLESKNSHLESRTDHKSVKIHELEFRLQEQKQRQQYFTLFLAAIIFALVCLLFSTQKDNLPSIS